MGGKPAAKAAPRTRTDLRALLEGLHAHVLLNLNDARGHLARLYKHGFPLGALAC